MAVSTDTHRLSNRLQTALAFVKPYWADRRVRILSGVVLLVIAIAWYWVMASSATLTVAGRHSFRKAEISIWVDGDLKSTFEVSGSAKKRLGVLQKIDGSFSRSLRVGAGPHTVRVRVLSLTDGTDIVRQCQANAASGTQSTVYVNADRGLLSVGFASGSPRSKPEPESSGGYMKLMQSVLMAVAGSTLSAVVGFLVQDFLKSRKGGNAVAQVPPTASPQAAD
jgi:hypothetical protein